MPSLRGFCSALSCSLWALIRRLGLALVPVAMVLALCAVVVPVQTGLVPVAVAEPAAGEGDESVPSNPLSDLPAPSDDADRVATLPTRLDELPSDDSGTADADATWSVVPGLPVEIRASEAGGEPGVPSEGTSEDSTGGADSAVFLSVPTETADPSPSGEPTVEASPSESSPTDSPTPSPTPVAGYVEVVMEQSNELAGGSLLLTFDEATTGAASTSGSTSESPSPSPSSASSEPSGEPSSMASEPAPDAGESTASGEPSPAESAVPSPSSTDDESAPPSGEVPVEEESPGEGDFEPLDVRLTYRAFEYAFGGAWGDRLEVTAYPECFVSTPELPECGEGIPVEVVNDPAAERLSFTTIDPGTLASTPTDGGAGLPGAVEPQRSGRVGPGAGTVTAVSVGVTTMLATSSGGAVYVASGGSGNFAATPMSPSTGWQVGEGSGEFSYSYPFELPQASGGQTPGLALEYSSGSVDAMSLLENGQASSAGLGWGMSPGYISRSYSSCKDDGLPNKGDLCWNKKNQVVVNELSIVLNGRSSRLVPIPDSPNFRLLNDPGWRVQFSKASNPVLDGTTAPDNTDDNDEAFKVTTPDGTVYWFGWGRGSSSVFTVPVYGNDPNEPCNRAVAADSWCQQAWQWSLDRVIDTSGNEIEYTYAPETNYYARYASTATENRTQYDRGGRLAKIEYGFDRTQTDTPRQVVEVSSLDRCTLKLTDPTADCSGANSPANRPGIWPDVPADLICQGGGTCTVASPTFFSMKRYHQVTTNTVSGRGANRVTRVVDRYTLTHTMPDPDGSSGPDLPDLWLNEIVRTGVDGANTSSLPAVQFDGDGLQNRVDVPSGERPLKKYRIGSIRNELGGRIGVVYGHNPERACDPAYVNGRDRWNSTKECFPQKYAPPGKTPKWEWFHKYVVTRIGLGDDALGYRLSSTAPDPSTKLGQLRVYDYEYKGAPAWRYQKLDNIPDLEQTWSDWRGYAETYIYTRRTEDQQIVTGANRSLRRVLVYRGMNNSRIDGDPANVSKDVRLDTQEHDRFADEPVDSQWLQGRVAEESIREPGQSDPWIKRTYREYNGLVTAELDESRDARIVNEVLTRTHTRKNNGGTVTHEIRVTEIDQGGADQRGVMAGSIKRVFDLGDTSNPDDNTCIDTNWRGNGTVWLKVPGQRTVASGECSAYNPTNEAAFLTRRTPFYDGEETAGADPTKGRVTKVETVRNAVPLLPPDTVVTRTEYDKYGRVSRQRDAKTNWTDYTYTTQAELNDPDGLISRVIVSQPTGKLAPQPTALKSTTLLDQRRSQPVSVTDPNGKETTTSYNPLGRVLEIDLPGNPASGNASIEYQYSVTPGAPSRVVTRTKRNDGAIDASYVFVDGWGRTIEQQVRQPDASADERIVTMTGYDDQGLVRYAMSAVPNQNLIDPFGTVLNPLPGQVDRYTQNEYDAAGRITQSTEKSPAGDTSTTWISYDGLTTRMNRSGSAAPVETRHDVWGRPARVDLYKDASTIEDTAAYTYDGVGRLQQISKTIDAQRYVWGYDYDLTGNRTQAVDPDTGTTHYTYDANGNPERAYGPGGDVSTAYDALNRPTRRTETQTGDVLAEWAYDDTTISNGLGRLHSSVSHTDLGDFSQTVTGYGQRGNPDGLTYGYPGDLVNSAGQATSKVQFNAYNDIGQPKSITYPGVGSVGDAGALKPLTVDYTYTHNGVFRAMKSGATSELILAEATYRNTGEIASLDSTTGTSTSGPGYRLNRGYQWDPATGRLDRIAGAQQGVEYLGLDYLYDANDNPIRINETVQPQAGATPQQSAYCYTYDGVQRLLSAKRAPVDPSVACSAAQGADYDLRYAYNVDRVETVTNTPAIGPAQTATYVKGTGAPHQTQAITSTGVGPGLPPAGVFEYDTAGRATKWTSTQGQARSYSYDQQGQLTSSTSGITRTVNAYNADGTRVARQIQDVDALGKPVGGRTTVLYLGETEITATTTATGSTTLTGQRHLATPTGTPVAIENGDGKWTWLLADYQNNIRLARDLTGETTWNNYQPFGGVQSTGTIPGNRGYLNKPRDPNGEIRLDHRSYDPQLGILGAPDPLLIPSDPQSLNPYAYARNNPIGFSDPSGLLIDEADGEIGGGGCRDSRGCLNSNGVDGYGVYHGDVSTDYVPQTVQDGVGSVALVVAQTIDFVMMPMAGPAASNGPTGSGLFGSAVEWANARAGVDTESKAFRYTGYATYVIPFAAGPRAVIGLVRATAGRVAANTGNRVFWSGGQAAKEAAMDYAKANGSKTLEMTTVGRGLERLPYNRVTAKLWDAASAGFAATARGDANVFIGPSFRGAESVFGRIEGPMLRVKGNPILQRFEDVW